MRPRCSADARRTSSSTISKRTVWSFLVANTIQGAIRLGCASATLSPITVQAAHPRLVNVRSVFLRNHALRWIVPTGVVGVVAIAASGVLSAQAISDLPPRTAAQLLVDVENAHVDGLSGTIVAKASLGIPALPSGAATSGNMLSLLSGSHTARVWYAGPDRQRFALLDTLSEADVFHNGRDIWTYDSATQEATPTAPTLTPEQAAEQALHAIDPTTIVSTDSARRVAGRDAYELVLAPRDRSSHIGSVRIAIDGKT